MDTQTRRNRAQAAISASERGDFEVATAGVIDLLSEDWNCSLAHRAWGRTLADQGKYSDAIASFRTAASLSPDDPELHFELALVFAREAESADYLQLQGWIEARDAVHAGLELDPASSLGRSLLQLIESQRLRVLS